MYSPVSGNEARGYVDVVIKRYEGDHALSKHIHSMREGEKVRYCSYRIHGLSSVGMGWSPWTHRL